jgi:uncharacterized protein involved in outer membrane biogenesis
MIPIVPSNGEYQKCSSKSKNTSALARTALLRYNENGGPIVTDRQRPRSWHRRIVITAAALCVAVLALLAAVVVIAPKVINSGEVRSRIEATIAKELHGTVTFDRVELSLLPRPDVVLHAFACDVPGTLSATISAVRVHALLIPLFRGQFAVSSISLEKPELTLIFPGDTAKRRTRKPPGKQPEGGSLDKALAVASRELPDLSITLSRGKISLVSEGRSFLSLGKLEASLAFVTDIREGTPARTNDGDYHITGAARATLSGTAALPAPLTVSIDRFDATPGKFSVNNSRTRLQDLDAYISGTLQGYLTDSPRSDIKAHGTIGPEALAWMQTIAGLPNDVRLRAPLTVSEARLLTTGTGSNASRTLTVNAGKKGVPAIFLTVRQERGLFNIDKLHVKDSDSDALMKLSTDPEGSAFSFAGNLTSATIDRVLENSPVSSLWLKGDMSAQVPRGQWGGATARGFLEGGQIAIPVSHEIPVTIDQFAIRADGSKVDLRPVVLSLGQDILKVEGSTSFSEDGVELDLDVATDRISLTTLRKLTERKTEEQRAVGPGMTARPIVNGSVHFHAAAFILDRYNADAVDVQMNISNERTAVTLENASVCGISFTGSLRTLGSEVEVTLVPHASRKKLEESLPCIFHDDLGVSGPYDLSAQLAGRGTWDSLLSSMTGSFVFSSTNGRIQSDHVVKGIITYLNSTSLFKGSHTELLKEGVPYEMITLRGTLRNNTIALSEAVIRSRDLHIAAEGNINLREGTLALEVIAAPFTRMDRLLGSVPLVKYIVGNALVVVPARVEGTFEHPSVKPLPVSSVGKNVTNLMKNTLQAPMKIIEPVIPKELEHKDERPQK